MTFPRVVVRWRDANGPHEPREPMTIADEEDYVVETMGNLILVGPLFLHLAPERTPDGRVRDGSQIPHGCVLSVTLLNEAGPYEYAIPEAPVA